MVQIVWLTNKAGNTGMDGGLPQVLSQALHDQSSIVEKPATSMTTFENWCADNGYVEYPTNLCDTFGKYLKLYGAPYQFSKEHRD
jgi:hypothetical protein